MPISVDHDQRRAVVISAAIRLIAKAGLEGVTVRDIAEAVGCSTAVVSHYFHNKRELLLLTYRATIERATERWETALVVSGGDIRAYLAELMPLDEERLSEWRVWLAFWAKAGQDPEIAEEQRQCVLHARGQILKALDALYARGYLRPEADRPLAARRVLATITGIAVQVMFDPTDWPNARQHEVVDAELRPLFRPEHLPAALSLPSPTSAFVRSSAT
jgi:AcrR family transcriptional regulator